MDAPAKERVSVKIFVGFEFTVDLSMKLSQSKEWKQASIENKSGTVTTIRYNDSDYIGKYIEHTMLTVKDIKFNAQEIREQLHSFLPEVDVDALTVQVFPQIFVT